MQQNQKEETNTLRRELESERTRNQVNCVTSKLYNELLYVHCVHVPTTDMIMYHMYTVANL